jgi:hypothetical protein
VTDCQSKKKSWRLRKTVPQPKALKKKKKKKEEEEESDEERQSQTEKTCPRRFYSGWPESPLKKICKKRYEAQGVKFAGCYIIDDSSILNRK